MHGFRLAKMAQCQDHVELGNRQSSHEAKTAFEFSFDESNRSANCLIVSPVDDKIKLKAAIHRLALLINQPVVSHSHSNQHSIKQRNEHN